MSNAPFLFTYATLSVGDRIGSEALGTNVQHDTDKQKFSGKVISVPAVNNRAHEILSRIKNTPAVKTNGERTGSDTRSLQDIPGGNY